jgi:hypothetical protein
MRLFLKTSVYLLFLFFLSACGVSDSASPPSPTRIVDTATAGSIHGVVSFEGMPPPSSKIPVARFSECGNASAFDADILIQNGKVKNAFVAITKGLESYRFEKLSEEVVLDQRHCLYEPRIVGLQVGQTLVVKNSDPALHNIHAQPLQSRGFNVGMAQQSSDIRKTFEVSEMMIPLRCDVHPWMRAYAGVLPHPYFAVTDVDGNFNLKNVPPGNYTVTVWHEKLGEKEFPVSIGTREQKTLNVSF